MATMIYQFLYLIAKNHGRQRICRGYAIDADAFICFSFHFSAEAFILEYAKNRFCVFALL